MNLDIYEGFLMTSGISIFTGGEKEDFHRVYLEKVPFHIPLIKAFLDDDDIQEITFTSGNIGFVRTWQKVFKKRRIN